MLGRLFVAIGLILCATTADASLSKNNFYPEEFYQAYEAGDATKVKKILKDLVHRKHRTLTYKQAREVVFFKLFNDKVSNKVLDVYCHEVHKIDLKKMPDPNIVNVEHTWPQSKFTSAYSRDMQKSDLNILFPVSARANTSRSNHPFGVIVKAEDSPCPATSERGYTVRGNDIRFEPPKVHQGNVARAIFYFALHYDTKIDKEETEDLMKWSRLDPVDQADRTRNDQIETIQGNRNPFIDYPELVDMLVQ